MKNLFISIIMPNFNGAKYIEQSIKSFINQDYPNRELIIVDGKSTDASHKIIKKYNQKHKNIIWVQEKDKGISNAFNIGFNYTKGDIIGYLGSDDLLYKDIFDEIAYANSWCNFDAIYFDSYVYYVNKEKCFLRKCADIINNNNKSLFRKHSHVKFNKKNLLRCGPIVGWQNIFFKKHVYKKYKIDEKNKYCMDYEFYLRISEEKYLYLYNNKIATVNIYDENISLDLDGKQFKEICKVTKKYSSKLFWISIYFKQVKYFLYQLIKKFL